MVSVKDLGGRGKSSPRALYDIVNRQGESVLAAALRRTGPAHPLTRVKEAVLVELSEELDGNCTWDEITKRFNEETGEEVSTSTVHRFCKR